MFGHKCKGSFSYGITELGIAVAKGACTWMDVDPAHPNQFTLNPSRRTRLTCADKTRFLMTAEDGSKHCIALTPQPHSAE